MIEIINQLTIREFFGARKEKLKLEWIAGQQGADHVILPDYDAFIQKTPVKKKAKHRPAPNKSLVGYLNLIHPHQIQILGDIELQYLNGIRKISMRDSVTQLFDDNPACIIIADNNKVPTLIKRKSNELSVPLFTSPYSSTRLADELHYYLTNFFADRSTLHGVYMEIVAIGVLITGPAGIGKSELALELISRGHRLIADDAPLFSRIAPDIIDGVCPPPLLDFLEVRGMGIINVRELFGDSAIKKNKYLKLIVQLRHLDNKDVLKLDRFEGSYTSRDVLGLAIPEITLPVTPGRNLAIMMECAARNHMLRVGGYNAPEVFAKRQSKLISQQSATRSMQRQSS